MSPSSPGLGAAMASLAAGPSFVTLFVLESLYARIPAAIVVSPREILAVAAVMVPALLVGFLIAFVPNVVGSQLMEALSRRSDLARLPAAWTIAGAASGAAIAAAVSANDAMTFVLAGTGAICARISRAYSLPSEAAVPSKGASA